MCNFLSGITMENGDVCISKNTDSHSEILEEFKISDKTLPPSFCAWEFTPPIKNDKFDYEEPYDTWNFNIDDNFPTPEWWDEGRKELTIAECKKELDSVIIKSKIDKIMQGRFVLVHGGTISEVHGGTISRVYGGTISRVLGGTISWVYGGTISRVYGGTISRLYGGTISEVHGGTISRVHGGTISRVLGGTISGVYGGTISRLYGGTISEVHGGTISRVNGGTISGVHGGTISGVHGGTISGVLGGELVFYIKPTITPKNDAVIIDRSSNTIIIITSKNKFEDKYNREEL